MRRLILILFILTLFEASYAKEIVFGTYPSNSPENIYKAFSVINSYLSKETGENMKLIVTKDYAELAERVVNGTVDIAWIGPVNYVKLKKKIPSIEYLATYCEISKATGEVIPYYQSYIIARKDSGITTLKQLENKSFAFVDFDSTSGYAYPTMMLKNAGINPKTYFSKVFFMKKHDRVIEALVNNSVAGGGVSDGTYVNAVNAYGNIFNILAKSDPIPLDAIIARADVDKTFKNKIQKALLKVKQDSEVNSAIKDYLGWPAAGFRKENDAFYNSLRDALGL